jgi:hypothetical protein
MTKRASMSLVKISRSCREKKWTESLFKIVRTQHVLAAVIILWFKRLLGSCCPLHSENQHWSLRRWFLTCWSNIKMPPPHSPAPLLAPVRMEWASTLTFPPDSMFVLLDNISHGIGEVNSRKPHFLSDSVCVSREREESTVYSSYRINRSTVL